MVEALFHGDQVGDPVSEKDRRGEHPNAYPDG